MSDSLTLGDGGLSGVDGLLMRCVIRRQQIYVEADAKMDTYETEDPNDRSKRVTRTSLNLLMRESSLVSCLRCMRVGIVAQETD